MKCELDLLPHSQRDSGPEGYEPWAWARLLQWNFHNRFPPPPPPLHLLGSGSEPKEA